MVPGRYDTLLGMKALRYKYERKKKTHLCNFRALKTHKRILPEWKEISHHNTYKVPFSTMEVSAHRSNKTWAQTERNAWGVDIGGRIVVMEKVEKHKP